MLHGRRAAHQNVGPTRGLRRRHAAALAEAHIARQSRPSMFGHGNFDVQERIDEMDATLASLEAKVSQVQADSKVRANQLIADLQKRRDDFQATVKKQIT